MKLETIFNLGLIFILIITGFFTYNFIKDENAKEDFCIENGYEFASNDESRDSFSCYRYVKNSSGIGYKIEWSDEVPRVKWHQIRKEQEGK